MNHLSAGEAIGIKVRYTLFHRTRLRWSGDVTNSKYNCNVELELEL